MNDRSSPAVPPPPGSPRGSTAPCSPPRPEPGALAAAAPPADFGHPGWRGIFGAGLESAAAALPAQRLGREERWVYAAGAAAGLGFFAGVRGLVVPWSWNRWLLAAAALAALAALGLGWRHRRGGDG